MAHKALVVACSIVLAASPAWAANQYPAPAPAPPGTPETRYCMHIEAITGSRIEKLKCWTREEWAEQEVDVDAEWAKEGVRTIG